MAQGLRFAQARKGLSEAVEDESYDSFVDLPVSGCPGGEILECTPLEDDPPHGRSSSSTTSRSRPLATFSIARNRRSRFAGDRRRYAVSSSVLSATSETAISISRS